MAAVSAACRNRIARDVKELLQSPPAGVSAYVPDERNASIVEAQVMGPEDTPYAGGVFVLRVTFPDRYPMEPPNVKFKTKVYHPNVGKHDGNICLSVLNMPPKAKELKSQPQLFRRRAAEWTQMHAIQDPRGVPPSSGGEAGPGGEASAAASCIAKHQEHRSDQPKPQPPQEEKDPSSSAHAPDVCKTNYAGASNTQAKGESAVREAAAEGGATKRPAEEPLRPAGSRLALKKRAQG
ncbi:hypothetical protein GPECTOR_22g822 [Gonium pectorale]|uniref:UBC core domain-containing protein n=1 Tax=Gonium pectorale TaxID=33097 RepID=A0A150GHA5_GONPE|nr:hypothetical protein GPECTOR_22g822 [Gonium pectorale]|eukprot:KXZ49231.1 hypothetical protein GPECTOR_22g822 [Gonium pectorale]